MQAALFPYIEHPILRLGPVAIPAFEVCVFAAVVTGYAVVVRRAVRLGWNRDLAFSLVLWTILLGFVGSHVFDVLLYQPAALRQDPLLLFKIWGTMSSFGGLLGGIAGALWITRRKQLTGPQIFEFIDIVAFAFPYAWIFGRLGCSLAHDHLGVASTSPLAVNFPGGPRYDLGLLELLFTLAIAALFLLLNRKPRPTGLYLGLFFASYGPVRFVLDVLRIGDERYLGWTPGQYVSVAAALFGGWLLFKIKG